MAFAPYGIYNRAEGDPVIQGAFRHKETKLFFEHGRRVKIHSEEPSYVEYPDVIFLNDGETRYAKVMKTRVKVVVDEDENGWVVETWPITSVRHYVGG